MRYGSSGGYHSICRKCEDRIKTENEWKGQKLLCHKCKTYKKEDCFTPNNNKNKIRKFRRYVCNECLKSIRVEKNRNLDTENKLKKCLRFRVLGAKDRATKHNIPFNLELKDVLELWRKQEGKCALSDVPMTFELNKGRVPTNVSIDKINKDLGYLKDNVQLVCMACNQIKSDLTEEEMYNFCKKIVNKYENKNTI